MWRCSSAGGPGKEAPSTNRNAPLLVAVVVVSVLLIVVLTFSVPRKEPERKGESRISVEIDFGGQGPGKDSNVSKIWVLSNDNTSSDNWSTNNIIIYVKKTSADWAIELEQDNGTVYTALEKASTVANFTFKSEWYPNFRSHRVNEIAGVRDGTDNRFWQYYVNGRYMGTGADLSAVSDGYVVRWEFRSALQ